jgi:drug/metabolite transporter (DMT)-like permease
MRIESVLFQMHLLKNEVNLLVLLLYFLLIERRKNMIYYLLLIIASLGIAGNFAFTKIYQNQMGSGIREGVLFNSLVGLFSGLIFVVGSGFKIEFTPFSIVMAVLFTLFIGLYTLIGFKIMELGSMTVYTVFLMLGGAVVPYLYGVAFLGETVNVYKIIALILVIIAVLVNSYNEKTGKQSTMFILLCLAAFCLNGGTSVVSKLHQIEKIYPVVSDAGFVVLTNIARFLCFLLILPFCKKVSKEHSQIKLSGKMYLIIFLLAIANGLSYMLQLMCASFMPATVLYPMITCGTITFTAALDCIFFKEKLSRYTYISILICFGALILFVIE